jgi:hypothetical protein
MGIDESQVENTKASLHCIPGAWRNYPLHFEKEFYILIVCVFVKCLIQMKIKVQVIN